MMVMTMRKKTIRDIINENRIKVSLNFNRLLDLHTPEKDVSINEIMKTPFIELKEVRTSLV